MPLGLQDEPLDDDVRELATLEEDPQQSSNDLKKAIQEQLSKPESEPEPEPEKPNEPEPETTPVSETEPESEPEKPAEISSEEIPEAPNQEKPDKENEIEYLKRTNTELLSILRQSTTKPNLPEQKKPEEKVLSTEEKLKLFSEDPDGFIQQCINKASKPEKDEIKKLHEINALNAARENAEFRRLEPYVKQLMDSHSDLVSDRVPYITKLELFFRLAQSHEHEYKAKKELTAQERKKQEQLKAKKAASSLPSGTKKTIQDTGSAKPIDKMTSVEIKAEINKLLTKPK